MIKIVDYELKHLLELRPSSCHLGEEHVNEISSPAVSFIHNGHAIAIFGGFMLAPKVMQVWGLVSDGVKKKPLAFHKAMKLMLEHVMESRELNRMQMSVRTGQPAAWKWAVALGFKCEGKMLKYGVDGTDYFLFARVAQ